MKGSCPYCRRELRIRIVGDVCKSEKCYRCGKIAPAFVLSDKRVRVKWTVKAKSQG